MSESRIDIVFRLKAKVYRLISICDGLKEKHDQSLLRIAELEKALAAKEKEVRGLMNENEKLKLAKAFSSSDDSKEAKVQISKIVREIDKCIALLNK
ncbi:hypothetical protein [Alistipes sp. ZOR0009]|jgi:hypothetical protein|uniref:hypothetical protein n=1 Tax=Alistipes sp. ZOR0009 TaxID=1339253 RepID=UPI000646F11E|nr:hypothetical protein [Alistipes sp. ZOR0009]